MRGDAEVPHRREELRRSDPFRGRQVVGRALLGASAVAALFAAAGALSALPGAETEAVLLAAWRAFGLAVFGGLFALVARDPTGYPGVLELAIAHKLALASTALAWREAPDAIRVLAADGALTVVLVLAYVLLGCHQAWRRAQGPDGGQRQRRPGPEVASGGTTSRR